MPPTDLILPHDPGLTPVAAILATATPLATVDDETYLHVAMIVRQRADGAIGYYCPPDAWPTSPAARLAARDAELAQLRARIAALEAEAGGPDPAVADGSPAPLRGGRGPRPADDAPVCCLICRQELAKGPQALRMHITKKHPGGRRRPQEDARQAGDDPACP